MQKDTLADEKFMRVINYDKLIKMHPTCPEYIPFDILDRNQSYRNHSQTLERLNERGGITPQEALAIIEKTPYRYNLDISDTIKQVNTYILKFIKVKFEV
jgi:hypothetical protein